MGIRKVYREMKKRHIVKKENRTEVFSVFCFWSVMGISFLFAAWILFLRLDDGLRIPRPKLQMMEFFTVLLLLGSCIYIRNQYKKMRMLQEKFRVFFVIAVLAGICARLG